MKVLVQTRSGRTLLEGGLSLSDQVRLQACFVCSAAYEVVQRNNKGA